LRLALSKGPQRVGATPSPFLREDGSRENIRNVVFKEKHWTMDKVLKKESSKCITPSSEPFRIDLYLYCIYLYAVPTKENTISIQEGTNPSAFHTLVKETLNTLRGYDLAKSTEFYMALFSVNHNISSEIRNIAIFRASSKKIEMQIKLVGLSMNFYCTRLHLSKRNGS
jgi:hypothetical protein